MGTAYIGSTPYTMYLGTTRISNISFGNFEKYFDINDGVISVKNEVTLPKFLIIPNEVNGETVTAYSSGMFKENTKIEKLVLSSNISVIPDSFCEGAINLKSILNTGNIISVGNYSFKQTRLKEIDLNCSQLGEGAFEYCCYLKTANMGGRIENLPKNTFNGCQNLHTLSGCQNVTSIGISALFNTKSLVSTDINFGNVTTINRMAIRNTALRVDWINESSYDLFATDKDMQYGEGYKDITSSKSMSVVNVNINQMNPLCVNRVVGDVDYETQFKTDYGDSANNYIFRTFTYTQSCAFLSLMVAYMGIKHPTQTYTTVQEIESQLKTDVGVDIFENFLQQPNKYYVSGDNVTIDTVLFIEYMLERLDFNGYVVKKYKDANKLDFEALSDTLSNGGYVLLFVSTGHNNTRNHAICGFGVDNDCKMYVHDSGDLKYLFNEYDITDYKVPIESCISQQNMQFDDGEWIPNSHYFVDGEKTDYSLITIGRS